MTQETRLTVLWANRRSEESFQFLMVNLNNVSFFCSALSSGQSERFRERPLGFFLKPMRAGHWVESVEIFDPLYGHDKGAV
jgi:hypothetical protein